MHQVREVHSRPFHQQPVLLQGMAIESSKDLHTRSIFVLLTSRPKSQVIVRIADVKRSDEKIERLLC